MTVQNSQLTVYLCLISPPSPPPPPSPRVDDSVVISSSEYHRLLMECHEILGATCDLVHARCAKILGIRIRVRGASVGSPVGLSL